MSADWSISRLQSWTCSSLSTVAEFVKLTQSIVIEIPRQSADLYKVQLCNRQFFCSVHSGLRGKGIRVSPAWRYQECQECVKTSAAHLCFVVLYGGVEFLFVLVTENQWMK